MAVIVGTPEAASVVNQPILPDPLATPHLSTTVEVARPTSYVVEFANIE